MWGYKPRVPWVPLTQSPHTVYFAQDVQTGHIKIGWTRRFEARMKALRCAVGPDRFRLLGTTAGTRKTESDLHRRFASDALGHEWFRPSSALLDLIESLPAATPTPEPAGRGGGR